jgi:hypothetical protein
MTVQELINQLSQVDPNTEVRIESTAGGTHSPTDVILDYNRDPHDSDFDYPIVLIK